MENEIGEVLVTEEEIRAKVKELAKRISEDYKDKELLLVGILKGAFMFLADLSRELTIPVQFDFIAVSSYGSVSKSSGVVRILKDLEADIEGRHVLIVEDVIDTGLTLNYLIRNFKVRRPSTLEICALLSKPEVQRVSLNIKYLGFSIPAKFVVGYGLDFAEKYRNLKHVATLKTKVATGR
ncbi:MAG: hypoxanthine phosphoribosyltransferase [Actinomycetota bacterium]